MINFFRVIDLTSEKDFKKHYKNVNLFCIFNKIREKKELENKMSLLVDYYDKGKY